MQDPILSDMQNKAFRLSGLMAATIAAFLTGCEKKAENMACYECEMMYASGRPAGTQYPCTPDIAQWQKEQKDNYGQPINSVCKEK